MTPLWGLVPGPLAMAALALLVRRHALVTRLVAALGWAQLGIVVAVSAPYLQSAVPWMDRGFRLDATAAVFLILTTLVATASLTHAVVFFDHELSVLQVESETSVAQFYAFTALFLLTMYGVIVADDLGYVWISMEATTLVSAPLVYYHRSRSSLEATWKYLLICSVAIAFAFFGTALFFSASQHLADLPEGTLSRVTLQAHAALLPRGLIRLGFVFMLLGYGTKAGLFPLHHWLPDAHSEAPSPASAILSGGMLNCALLPLWRAGSILEAAGDATFMHVTMLPMGVATVLAASLFLLRQEDLKRLWAYSSMENVGLMAVAISLGSSAGFVLQAINHSLVKVALFLLSGNVAQQFGTKRLQQLRGLMAAQPAQGVLLLAGAIAVAGTPPFGSFLAEWEILSTAADAGHGIAVACVVLALTVAFIAICRHVAAILFGARPSDLPAAPAPAPLMLGVPALLVVAALGLGVALPAAAYALTRGIAP